MLFVRPFRHVDGPHSTRNMKVGRGKIDRRQSTNLLDDNRYGGQTYIIMRRAAER